MKKSLQYAGITLTVFGLLGLMKSLNISAQSTPGTVVNSAKVTFPLYMPGDTILIEKVFNSDGKLSLRSNSPFITSPNDLVKLERREYDAKKKKYGAMNDRLIEKIAKLGETDSIVAQVSLKIQTNGRALDKMKYPIDILKAKAQKDLQRVPVIGKASFKQRHIIKEASVKNQMLSKSINISPDMVITKIDKYKLAELCFDDQVVSIEEYEEPQLCTCSPCSIKGITLSTPPCFSTLASSAYNPAWQMPSDSKGRYVNAATFESGLRQNFVQCMALGTQLKYYDMGYNGVAGIHHSEETFRCMTYAAPQANFYHRNSWTFDQPADEAFIHDNAIQTVSMSITNNQNPTDPEMRHIDSWAYRYPYTVFCNPTANDGYCRVSHWRCYNAINVGNVQHYSRSHYVLNDTDITINCPQCGTPCSYGHCTGGVTQTANPPSRYGSLIVNPFDCTTCNPGNRGDRELPMIVAPGISPVKYFSTDTVQYPNCGDSRMSDPCIYDDNGTPSTINYCDTKGTSYSAPITNGIAACVISADSRMDLWPEKVRVALLVTAHNVDFNYWNYTQDGRDGAGVMSGANAVLFAKNHTDVCPNNTTAVQDGICVAELSNSDQGTVVNFKIKIPNFIPVGKHLRIVLTWDSSPALNDPINDLSDLDLGLWANTTSYSSNSFDSNVEMLDIDNSQIAAGATYTAQVNVVTMRIQGKAYGSSIYYAIGWTWVKDHAD